MAFADLVAEMAAAQLDEFGELVTYTPAAGGPAAAQVTGIFDQGFVLVKGTAEAGVESIGPAIFLLLADLPTDPEDDDPILTIRAADYRVIERIPDGMGGIVLVLRSNV